MRCQKQKLVLKHQFNLQDVWDVFQNLWKTSSVSPTKKGGSQTYTAQLVTFPKLHHSPQERALR